MSRSSRGPYILPFPLPLKAIGLHDAYYGDGGKSGDGGKPSTAGSTFACSS